MDNRTLIGIDIGKSVLHVHVADSLGNPLNRKALRRSQVERFMASQAPAVVAMEGCAGAHHWARVCRRHGHEVRLIATRYARAYVKTNKNDWRDAEALVEALSRPTMRYAQEKTPQQQAQQMVHRVRQRVVQQRTRVSNQLRGFLAEYGLVYRAGLAALQEGVREALEDADNALPALARELFSELAEELRALHQQVQALDAQVQRHCAEDARCQALMKVPGIGALSASALVTRVGNAQQFARARDLSASLGLVPRQYSTGGRTQLGGISKRGDRYLRTLLVHGARAALARAQSSPDPLLRWALAVRAKRGHNVAVVALANKIARVAWAVLHREQPYRRGASQPAG